MQDARYWRGQAALCLEMARRLSDACAASKLRAEAEQHFTRAAEVEERSHPGAIRDDPQARPNRKKV
jgi:hypothetical protein